MKTISISSSTLLKLNNNQSINIFLFQQSNPIIVHARTFLHSITNNMSCFLFFVVFVFAFYYTWSFVDQKADPIVATNITGTVFKNK